MAALPKVLSNHADIKSAGGVALRVRTQGGQGGNCGQERPSKLNGAGTYTWPDGEKYVGEFRDDHFNGPSTYTWPDGRKHVGEWKDGKRNGHGTLYSSGGSVIQSGIWKNDTLVAPSAENSSNKAITSWLGFPEKTGGYLPLILLVIAAITAITAIFLMKDRTEHSIRVSSHAAGAQCPQQPEQVQQPSDISLPSQRTRSGFGTLEPASREGHPD